MKDTTEILAKLRKLMQNPPRGSAEQLPPLSAYIIPSDDAHQSEYICKHDERRAYVSGFDGSAGTAVVTSDKALLWTDGRYYQQAGKQMDSNWTLMKDGLPTTPTIGAWLAKNLSKGSAVGVDPKLVSFRVWKPIQKDLAGNDCVLLPVQNNLIDIIWANEQPKQTSNKVITLDLKFCGSSIKEKWNELKKQMCEKKTEAIVVSALDEIAWFLNLRGSDIDYNPVFFAYLIVTLDNLNLFIDADKLPSKIGDHETINEVKIITHAYNSVSDFLKNLANKSDEKIWIAPGSSYFLADLIPKQKRHQEITPIAIMKAIKNETEAQGFVNCHIRDGAALCKYFAWLEDMVRKGEPVNEISGASKLEEFRSKNDLFMGLSFPTISSSGPNGSVIHYHPAEETNRQIVKKEIYLCDSGAQYLDGTTDVTRTMHFGEPTEFEKETYTRVIKGQLSFGSIVFPNKVKGQVLDTLARKALWDVGLDYGHGTGHGVGHFLNVHEGPMGVGTRLMPDDPGLQENMFISNEPGYYKDGEFGIRIEDIVQIVKANDAPYNFAGRGALTFKTVTMCPKQTKMIKKELLTDVELKLLNEYHELVLKTLSPIFEKDGDSFTLEWLKRNTQKL